MRTWIKPLFLIAAGTIASLGLLSAGGVQPALAAPAATTLPITSYYQMAVDAAHGHIFISQGGSGQDGILVTDLTGQVVTTITGQDGVFGLTLSPGGSTLYAALGTADAVTAISTATLTQTASYALPAGDSPYNVAVQSGKIWVSYNTGTLFAAGVGYFDLSASSPALQTPAIMGGWESAPQIAADPADTGVLVATGTNGSVTGLASYDTAANPVTTIAGSPGGTPVCVNEEDLAVAPGGAQFAVACHDGGAVDNVYSTASLSVLRALGSSTPGAFPVAIAYDGAGDIAAGTTTIAPSPDLDIYPPGGTTALNAYTLYTLSAGGGILVPRGLGWLPDGSQVFGVLNRITSYALVAVTNPTVPKTDPTTTGVFCSPGAVIVGQATSCTAFATDTGSSPTPPTGVITLASGTSGGSFSSSSCTLSPDGTIGEASCAFSYTPGQVGSGAQTITANYAGDGNHAASSGQAVLTVTLSVTNTAVSCSPGAVTIGQATSCTAFATDTASSPTPPTGVITLASGTSGGSFSSSSCTLSPDGTIGEASCAFSYTPGQVGSGAQTITANYGGDGSHAASSGQVVLIVTLRVTSTALTCKQVKPVLEKCTTTVSDTSPGSATAPTGTVSFSSSGRGVFSAKHCTLSGRGKSASCTVYYRRPAGVPMKAQTMTAVYSGDSTHQSSTGSIKLK